MKLAEWMVASVLLMTAWPATAETSIDSLARAVERAESIRSIKNLQRTYAQYAQFGLWAEMSALFSKDAILDSGLDQVKGRAAISAYFASRHNGRQGLAAGEINTHLIENPVVNLSPDGKNAKGRWDSFILLCDATGNASIRGGIYENDYVKERGVWKIAHQHFFPQYEGDYETGWTNVGGQDLPVVPYHFDGDGAGVPIPAPVGAPPKARASLAQLEERIRVLNDEDKVRNLQAAYNYYVDRKMWDDVSDLFAADSVLEIGGVGIYDGPKGARKSMERMGSAGLTHGQLNDHLVFDNVAQVLPGGREARTRGIELGMVGEADKGEAHWELNVFDNRFVKENGIWKMREMRIFPLFRSEYHKGWGKSRMIEPAPAGALAPDHSVPAADLGSEDAVIPAFHSPNPATGRKVTWPPGKKFVASEDLTKSIRFTVPAAARGNESTRLNEAARRLSVSTAYDGAENVSSSYGFFIDDYQWREMARIFGQHGAKEVPFAGYYAGAGRIAHSVYLEYGDAHVSGRSGIAFHWRIQPVINVSSDGRSASVRTYLFHPDTAKMPGSAGIMSGMYMNDQFVLEDGIWRFWNLSLNEPYFTMPGGWERGWSGTAPPRQINSAVARPAADPNRKTGYFGADLVKKFPPDVPISALGAREEHIQGGTGETWAWPKILPMWWGYKNPVSGRTPENFLPDCVPCDYAPDMSMAKHGYLLPPTGPEDTPVK